MSPRNIQIADYNYPLPDERIARYPLTRRDQSKLLIYRHGEISEDVFSNIPSLLPKGALMVFNNTKVIQARMHFRKQTGALIEVFLLEPVRPADYEQMFQTNRSCSWLCMVGNLKKWKEGSLSRTFTVSGSDLTLTATRGEVRGASHWIDFNWDRPDVTFADILDAVGELPIPPYLNRDTEDSDKTTYQTVYSKIKGSVAAPTAGLHFTPEVLAAIDEAGIHREELTLHVGAGTFKPVKSSDIGGHDMHTEYVSISRSTLQSLLDHGASAIAVGTTSVRTLESLYYMGLKVMADATVSEADLHVEQWEPYEGPSAESSVSAIDSLTALAAYMDRHSLQTLHASTRIIIAPGYRYHVVRMLVTNFHQPQSTLLLLVSALVGNDWHRIYDYALGHGFRFLSYGDSSLLIP